MTSALNNRICAGFGTRTTSSKTGRGATMTPTNLASKPFCATGGEVGSGIISNLSTFWRGLDRVPTTRQLYCREQIRVLLDICSGIPSRAMVRPVSFLLLLSLFGLAFPRGASAQEVAETVGSRALGMGGAFVAVSDDAMAVYWNPAGLASGG